MDEIPDPEKKLKNGQWKKAAEKKNHKFLYKKL